jgi:DNA-binding NarL/FixJ family response regulator
MGSCLRSAYYSVVAFPAAVGLVQWPGKISVADLVSNQSTKPIRTLIADDFVHMQTALAECLQAIPNIVVVGSVGNGQEALDQLPELKPDLAIVDLQMPIMDGFRLLRELRRRHPEMRLIAVSGHQSPAVEKEAISAGANGFVSKSQLPDGLIKIVERVLAA